MQCIWILKKRELGTTKNQLVMLKLIGSTLFAWGALDVFAFGAIVTVVELNAGSLIGTTGFMSSLISNLRSSLDIPGDEDVIIALRPRLCAGAYLVCIGAFMFNVIGVQFIRFLGRLQFVPFVLDGNNVAGNKKPNDVSYTA